jgi:hypothetical protein
MNMKTKTRVGLDYPKAGETISSTQYTLRISASDDAKEVSVSIDGARNKSCRRASGHFWYDWSGYRPGPHELAVAAVFEDGTEVSLEPRAVTVDPRIPSLN